MSKEELQKRLMEVLRSITVSGLSVGSEIFRFGEHSRRVVNPEMYKNTAMME